MIRLFTKLTQAVSFLVYFLAELIRANLRLARDVVRPLRELRPAIIAVPLDLDSSNQITVLANLVTLTPGTLSLDVSTDRRVLYIHVMNVTDVEKERVQIKTGFERRIRELAS